MKHPEDELLLFLCETKLAIFFFSFLGELIKLGLNYLLDHCMCVIHITQGVLLMADFSGIEWTCALWACWKFCSMPRISFDSRLPLSKSSIWTALVMELEKGYGEIFTYSKGPSHRGQTSSLVHNMYITFSQTYNPDLQLLWFLLKEK